MLLIHLGAGEDDEMNFFRNVEARDWIVAVTAFIAGAWIF
jgi:hypothetical protein